MSISFRNALNEQLKDPVLKKEVESLETEFSMIRALIASRKEKEITQKELSKLIGIAQADLSKIENGNVNPSLKQ